MKKQTAVEWLMPKILELNLQLSLRKISARNSELEIARLFEQAKAMEKEQMIETWHNGYNNQSPMIDEENCAQQYYKETYEQ